MRSNEVSPSDRQTVRIAFNLSASHSSQLSRSFQTGQNKFRRTWLCEHGSVASVSSRGEGLDVLWVVKFAKPQCRVQPARTHLGDAYTAHAQGSSSISAHAFTNTDMLNTIFREGSSIEDARYVLY